MAYDIVRNRRARIGSGLRRKNQCGGFVLLRGAGAGHVITITPSEEGEEDGGEASEDGEGRKCLNFLCCSLYLIFARTIFKELHQVLTNYLLLTEILSTSDAYELFIGRNKSTVINPAVDNIYKLDGCFSELLDCCCLSLGLGKYLLLS